MNDFINNNATPFRSDHYLPGRHTPPARGLRHWCLLLFAALVIFLPGACGKYDITLTTDPSMADVYINDVFAGKTPYIVSGKTDNGSLFPDRGKAIRIRIIREFYLPVTQEISFSQTAEKDLHFTLRLRREMLPEYNGLFQPGYELTHEDMAEFDTEDLVMLQHELAAKYGKIFGEPEISAYFRKQSWYRENPYFDESFFDETDKKNKTLISDRLSAMSRNNVSPIGIGTPSENDLAIKKTILGNVEYIYDSGEIEEGVFGDTYRDTCTLIFRDAERVLWHDDSNHFGTYYAAIDGLLEWHWEVYRGKVYVWDIRDDAAGYIVFIFTLDHTRKTIAGIPEIDGNIW
ncbi:MAG: YARHG domain-containing protein [Spirochaetales bacterium]|nr:YARHG domain-containing protein [Spirochaetales bacterium]